MVGRDFANQIYVRLLISASQGLERWNAMCTTFSLLNACAQVAHITATSRIDALVVMCIVQGQKEKREHLLFAIEDMKKNYAMLSGVSDAKRGEIPVPQASAKVFSIPEKEKELLALRECLPL